MAHAYGDADAGKHDVRERGSSTNRLTSDEVDFDPITGQALQSPDQTVQGVALGHRNVVPAVRKGTSCHRADLACPR